MIELVSIDVTNFRSFGQAQFAPLGVGQGLTAINGANGTGKSSIATHALLWCLYGVTPEGVTVKSLRRQESDGEVRVTVTFRHDGDTVTVTRALRGKNDSTVAGITVNDVEQTSVSARTATAWVTQRLGVDAEAFMTAFVIRQKEVDALVRARPAERRALIERLAGIDRMSAALSKAREEARVALAEANAIRVDVDPAAAAADADAAVLAAGHAEAAADTADEQAASLQRTADAAHAHVASAEAAAAAVTAARHKVDLAEAAAAVAAENLNRVSVAATEADRLPDMQAAAAAARAEREQATQAVLAVEVAVAAAGQDEVRAQAARAEADTAAEHAAATRTQLTTATAHLNTLTPVSAENVEAAAATAEDLRNRWSVLNAEVTRLGQVLNALTDTLDAGHATCPTCAQGLAHPDDLIAGLRGDLARREADKEQAGTAGRAAAEEHARLRDAHATFTAAVAAVTAAEQRAAHAEEAADAAEQRAAHAEEAAESSAEEAHLAAAKAATADRHLPALEAAEAAAEKGLRRAEAAAEAAEELPAVQAAADAATQALTVAVEALHTAEKSIEGLDLDQARSDAAQALQGAQEGLRRAADLRAAARVATQEAQHALDRAAAAEAAAQGKQAALAAAEVAQATASALEEFRRDRLARLAPELSEVASDIIATMTEGRYTAVEMDEDFTPVLVEAATGLERPTSWLSGGEESAVALALRLAIGDVVAGQQNGLLVLDEVLTAHDKARRAAVMTAVRALPHRQVITINHASEATDQVDLIAHVIAETEGSIIEHSAGESAAHMGGLDLDS